MIKAYSYIRFSTPEQRKGNSLDRQLKATREYCEKNGLVLDEQLITRDLGVSAFKGKNVKNGGLGHFLLAIEEGKVQPGSLLIVESLDRISRLPVMAHLPIFMDLIEKGITIVTLIDGNSFSKQSLNQEPYGLISSIITMGRAHEESQTKSKRLIATWEAKRASGKPLTTICPSWLRFEKERGKFEVIPERVVIVQRIFELAAAGVGRHTIEKTLNAEGQPTWKNGRGWHASYVEKILSNRAVLGEFQPHRKVDGKRVPDGLARTEYFPQIIQVQQFQAAKARRLQNFTFLGKTGKNVTSNLFTGIATCGYSGFPMVYVNKGKWRYLVSDNAKRGLGAKYASWPYEDFENRFILALKDIDLRTILNLDETSEKQLVEEIKRIEKEIKDLTERVEYLLVSLEQAGQRPQAIIAQIGKLEGEAESKKKLLPGLRNRLDAIRTDGDEDNFLETIKAFEEQRNDPMVRLRLKEEIRSKIKGMRVFAAGAPNYSERYGDKDPFVIVKFPNGNQFIYGKENGMQEKGATLLQQAVEYGRQENEWEHEVACNAAHWDSVWKQCDMIPVDDLDIELE